MIANALATFADQSSLQLAIAVLLLSTMIAVIFRPGLLVPRASAGAPKNWLERHTDAVDAIPVQYLGLAIALAAALGLFAELMIIRLHSSYFQLFAYFKNVSLLSCFLGLGIGYGRGARRPLTTPLVIPVLALQIIFMYFLRNSPVTYALQSPIAEQVGFGVPQAKEAIDIGFAYFFLLVIFAFNALCFVPLGHLAARLMDRQPSLVAYGWNLAGSLLGIAIFSLVSFTWAPPTVWVILCGGALLVFVRHDARVLLPTLLALAVVVLLLAKPVRLDEADIFSPYQILTLVLAQNEAPVVRTSNTYYQRILDLSDASARNNETLRRWSDYYGLPYDFKPKPRSVLVVGSGTGNDVAAAVRNGAQQVDAVEIDPAILELGVRLHPERPYQEAGVRAILDDARTHIRYTDKRYDLIVYGLLDSHTLLSGRGGIRLDSYVYTVEGFREARARLNPGGAISLTFSLLHADLGHKLYLMLEEAFDGASPLVYQVGYDGGYTFLAGDGLQAPATLPAGLRDVTKEFAGDSGGTRVDKSTDDWPFFYMPAKTYPQSYALMIVALLVVSLLYVRSLMPGAGGGFSLPCFFLGAGFMLVETKGITELALVYGSTWVVISAVTAAIMILGFLANLIVMKAKTPSPVLTYGLLFAALLAGLGLTVVGPGNLDPWLSRIVMTTMLTLPLFFSGFAFSTELRKAGSVQVALSANLLGAMLGGFLEYNSMYFGFRSLYIFALVVYALAFLTSLRTKN